LTVRESSNLASGSIQIGFSSITSGAIDHFIDDSGINAKIWFLQTDLGVGVDHIGTLTGTDIGSHLQITIGLIDRDNSGHTGSDSGIVQNIVSGGTLDALGDIQLGVILGAEFNSLNWSTFIGLFQIVPLLTFETLVGIFEHSALLNYLDDFAGGSMEALSAPK